jgi:hypothetical protein
MARFVSAPRFTSVFCLVVALATGGTVEAASGFRILYAERVEFDDGSTRAESTDGAAPGEASARTKRARFDAFGRRFELALERNDRVLGTAATRDDAPQVWRGTLAGLDGSWARLTVANGRRYGMIWDGRDLYVIEPAVDASASMVGPAPASGDTPIVYRLSDTLAPAGAAHCGVVTLPGTSAGGPAKGTDRASRSGLDTYRQMVGELQRSAALPGSDPGTSAANATRRLQVSAVADYEYAQAVGAASARDRIIARFNNIDGIFAAQVGVQIELASPIRVYETATQPFSSTASSTLLTEVGSYRQSLVQNAPAQAGGLTHLVTGRNLDGTTVGIAYIGSLCLTRFGVSLSQGLGDDGRPNSFGDLIAAHEIGHNFGAPHDGETPSDGSVNPCQTVSQDYVMAPRINGSRTFSQCSLDQIAPQVARASCLLPAIATAPTVDLGVAVPGTTVRLLAQRTADASATVTNLGTAATSNPRLRFTLPAGLQAVSGAATNGGLCGTQPTGYECTWPVLSSSASASATVTLRGTTAGSYSVGVQAIATGDVTAANDAANYAVVVDALPDLALEVSPSNSTIDVDQSVSLQAVVRNPGAVAVDGGSVRFELPTNAQSITPAPAGCTNDAAGATCSVGRIGGAQSVTLRLPVRGVSAGTGSVRATLTSADDASTTNNAATVALTVSAPAPAPAPPPPVTPPAPAPTAVSSNGGGGGGGGAIGAWDLAALLALLLARRRRTA